jgi:hypothetical protein
MKDKLLAQKYIEHGNKYGFASAECILSKHVPDGVLEGKCYMVPDEKRKAFVTELKKGSVFEQRTTAIIRR